MRIIIDLQGAQTESRFRGIGRYSLSLAKAMVRNCSNHEIIIVLSNLFPETIEPIRAEFNGILSQDNIRVWYALDPVKECDPKNNWRREAAELIRESFIASLQPDIIYITSLFEGYGDNAVISIGKFDQKTPVSVSLYDLIPLLNPEHYLYPHPLFDRYYHRKINYLKKSALLLAISEYSRQEGIDELIQQSESIVNISTAIESNFQPLELTQLQRHAIQKKFTITRSIVLYTGGADERKNLLRLISAYAKLSLELREAHQLVFAGKMPAGNIQQLQQQANSVGLHPDELVFTGYITDDELVKLYNLCELYVFPSWHEGFGLPALEAMSCGAAVIAANTTSLPEVIGNTAALFDPLSECSITDKMASVLTNKKFRQDLIKKGLVQAENFSWDKSAQRGITAFEKNIKARDNSKVSMLPMHSLTNKIATILPSDISEQELISISESISRNHPQVSLRQLFVDVSELSQRDSATGVQRVTRSILMELLNNPPVGYRVEPVYATPQVEGYFYAKKYTAKLLGFSDESLSDELLSPMAGDIFLGLDLQHHVVTNQSSYYEQLKNKSVTLYFVVYDLLPITFFQYFAQNHSELHAQWLAVISQFNGLLCISETVAKEVEEWLSQYVPIKNKNLKITHFHMGADIENSIPSKGLLKNSDNLLKKLQATHSFLMVGTIEPRKGQNQVLSAFEVLWSKGNNGILVIVGKPGWMTDELINKIQVHSELGKRLFWLNGISDEYLEKVYEASTCLIAASEGEGFGLPLIEAAQHQLPMIIRNIPVFKEVAGEYAYYFKSETAQGLAEVVEKWLKLYKKSNHPLSDKMPWLTWKQSTDCLLEKILPIEKNEPVKQLLVDISELVQRDARSGIQRVVRGILKELLTYSSKNLRIEPVYATVEQGYRYARDFTAKFSGESLKNSKDNLIEYQAGDIFLGLDLQPQINIAQQGFYQQLRRHGVQVQFIVHDLLAIRHPEWFPEGSYDGYFQWLKVITEVDGAICVSQATADDLKFWMEENNISNMHSFRISVSHNGADISSSAPSKGLPKNAGIVIKSINNKPSFLVVGTIEPRKGITQTLTAFELLWEDDVDINLVLVGKEGWMVEELIQKINNHPELGKRLFWLQGISDEYLENIYSASSCLIAPSEGEGFGLPLIEAAQHRLPIIARDIPVFREVASEYAYYFKGDTSSILAAKIHDWLMLFQENKYPSSKLMPWLTWKKNIVCLLNILKIETLD